MSKLWDLIHKFKKYSIKRENKNCEFFSKTNSEYSTALLLRISPALNHSQPP